MRVLFPGRLANGSRLVRFLVSIFVAALSFTAPAYAGNGPASRARSGSTLSCPIESAYVPVEFWDLQSEGDVPPNVEIIDVDLGDPPEDAGVDFGITLPRLQQFALAPPVNEVAYEYGQDYCGGVLEDEDDSSSQVALQFFAPGFYVAKAVPLDPTETVKILRIRVGVTELSDNDCDDLLGSSMTVDQHTQSWTGTGTFAMVARGSDLDRAMNIYPGAVRVNSLNDILQAAAAAYRANGNQRVRAILVSHGSTGSFRVGSSRFRIVGNSLSGDTTALGAIREHVNQMEVIACCLAYGVANSRGELYRRHFLPRFATNLQRPVSAYDRTIGIALRFSVFGQIIRESYFYAHVPLLWHATWYTVPPQP